MKCYVVKNGDGLWYSRTINKYRRVFSATINDAHHYVSHKIAQKMSDKIDGIVECYTWSNGWNKITTL